MSRLLVVLMISAIILIIIISQTIITENNFGKYSILEGIKRFLQDTFIFIPLIGNADNTVSPSATPPNTTPPPNPTLDRTHTPTSTTTSTVTPGPDPTNTPTSEPIPSDMILVDHTSIALFEDIPQAYLDAARDLSLVWADDSVGGNISDSLDCLSAASWGESPGYCRNDYYSIDGSTWLWRTFTQEDYDQGVVPERILFVPDPVNYNRNNWTYVYFTPGGWYDNTDEFVNNIAPAYLDTKDVLTFQFSYLKVVEGSNIIDPENGFFADVPGLIDIYDLEEYIAAHPDKYFVFWTTSLARGIGTQEATEFNNMMRQYAIENNKILFDVADIEAHTDLGAACFDNRDGIEYCNQNSGECENYPDDGLDLPAICQDYTADLNGGHLTPVSAGKIALAKAYWVLMAQIAGWNP